MAAKAKRADGRYQITVSLGNDPATGKRIRKVFYGVTQKEARQKRDAWMEEYNANTKTVKVDDGTVSAWVDKWMSIYGNGGGYSMRIMHKQAANKIKEHLGEFQIRDVKKSDIQIMANAMKTYGFSTVKKTSWVVKRVFADAYADMLITVNPCIDVKWAYVAQGTHRALEEWERNLIKDNWSIHRTGTWAMLMLFAGLRRGEALALQWRDIYDGYIHVTRAMHFEGKKAVMGDTPKTFAGIRDIPITTPLIPVLSGEHNPDDFVCISAKGEAVMTPTAVDRGWETYQKQMTNILNGEPAIQPGKHRSREINDPNRARFKCRMHDLRHTFCTMLFEADVDLKTAQRLMGHADASMTLKIYTHLSEVKQKASYEKMQDYFSKWR